MSPLTKDPRSYWSAGRSLAVGAYVGKRTPVVARLRPLEFTPFEEDLAGADEHSVAWSSRIGGATVAELGAFLDSGELTAVGLALHYLRRIREHDGVLGSMIELNPEAVEEARAADERRRVGASLGPLDGIPISVKDNIESAPPLHTTAGAVVLADHVGTADAPVLAAMRRAGVVVLGKANLSELAGAVCRTPGVSAVGGRTRNAYGDRFTPGGSSSGSAVSVAAGLCAVSVGTETSGSLVAPASFNGLVGMKPSGGLVSGEGVVPLVSQQDSPGPIGRCVSDVAATLAAMTDQPLDAVLSVGSLQGATAGLFRADILAQRSPFEDVSDNPEILTRITSGMGRAGAEIVDLPPTPAPEGMLQVVLGGLAHDTVAYLDAVGTPVHGLADLHAYLLAEPETRMPRGQFFVDAALVYAPDRESYEEAAAALAARARDVLDALFESSGSDLLVSLGMIHSPLYATACYPAVTVPLGLRSNGMPVGVTLIARRGHDALLLSWAYAFEQATRLRRDPEVAD